MTRFQTDKTLEKAERIMLVSIMLSDSFSGSPSQRERAFLHDVQEAQELILATGGELIHTHLAKRDKAHSALFVGTGKAQELAELVAEHNIQLVIFNHELTPTQERNLERVLQCRVLDRVGLILAIFAQRAQTKEGKLQVELAQLTHLSTRLVRGYQHLKSQKGGIGLKGPGETQLETDRRLIQSKIHALHKQLDQVKKQRQTQRAARLSGSLKTLAIVGYTNAGKSTLFNRLTKSDVLAKDQLFATLDTTTRRLFLNEETSVILADTVGFIQNLPHQLIAAFTATLEETALADGLLHIVDYSDDEYERKIDDVNAVLKNIHADQLPQLLIYNKIDKLPETNHLSGSLKRLSNQAFTAYISATHNLGINELRNTLIDFVQTLNQKNNFSK